MTATNHMMTGALIALAVHQPVLAIPLAFVSHFATDMIPHYGYGDVPFHERDTQEHFLIKQTIDSYTALVVFWLLPYLLRNHQAPWVTMWCMFAAAIPDVVWVYQYVIAQRKGIYASFNWYAKFHKAIQWCERPWGAYVELAWFILIVVSLKLLVS